MTTNLRDSDDIAAWMTELASRHRVGWRQEET
jgi:hypothetical protein